MSVNINYEALSYEDLTLKRGRIIYNRDAYENEIMFGIMKKGEDNSYAVVE